MSGDGVWPHTSDVYVLDWNQAKDERGRLRVEPILRLISDVSRQIGEGVPSGTTTYEDLAFTLQQMRDALSNEYENPAVCLLPISVLDAPE